MEQGSEPKPVLPAMTKWEREALLSALYARVREWPRRQENVTSKREREDVLTAISEEFRAEWKALWFVGADGRAHLRAPGLVWSLCQRQRMVAGRGRCGGFGCEECMAAQREIEALADPARKENEHGGAA